MFCIFVVAAFIGCYYKASIGGYKILKHGFYIAFGRGAVLLVYN